jgi:IS5 family transposase
LADQPAVRTASIRTLETRQHTRAHKRFLGIPRKKKSPHAAFILM